MKTMGKSYRTRSGKFVPAKVFTKVTKCCRKNCWTTIACCEQMRLFLQFYAIKTKNLQDNCIVQHMTATTVKTSVAPSVSKYTPRSSNWKYALNLPQPVPVCQKMFLNVFQVRYREIYSNFVQ